MELAAEHLTVRFGGLTAIDGSPFRNVSCPSSPCSPATSFQRSAKLPHSDFV